MAKKVKKKLNKKGLLVVLLTLYLFIMAFYYCFNLPVKLVEVKGNTIISDEKVRLYYDDPAYIYYTNYIRKFLEEYSDIENIKKGLLHCLVSSVLWAVSRNLSTIMHWYKNEKNENCLYTWTIDR